MDSTPKPGIPLLVLLLALVVATSLGVGYSCLIWGQHGASQCAIDYPHDGQCGLVAMEGMAFAVFATPATIIVGVVVVVWRWRAARKDEGSN